MRSSLQITRPHTQHSSFVVFSYLFDFTTFFFFFFFNDTATTEIYTLSLHDALPIFVHPESLTPRGLTICQRITGLGMVDRKSTRLNSSHVEISYAVFCLKKKKNYILTNNHKLQVSITST